MGFALVLVGHVTKEGAIAGPMILEHLVDCVAYFEGDRFHSHRLIRAVKNRFGSTDELGIFEMTDAGLIPIADPSKLFLQSGRQSRPGSVVLAACEGTRTLLVEVQALCAQSVFGAAKRKATGVDAGRVSMILAVIEKHADCVVGDQDVFVNVVGGVRVNEPAADLAIALAVIGAMTNRSLPATSVVCGELGLGAELRPVHHLRQRVTEAARIGFKQFILPKGEPRSSSPLKDAAIEIHACESLSHALRQLA
jgi:DNA repair protein RadA/Sms